MRLDDLARGFLLVSLLTLAYSGRPGRTHARRCRCKKLLEEINKTIDDKLRAFEKRIASRIPDSSAQHQNESIKLQEIESKMSNLNGDVHKTKKALQRESHTLRFIREQMYAQKQTMNTLNDNFGLLESIVRNLTSVVERLENLISPNMETTTELITTTMATTPLTGPPTPPPRYPRHCHEVFLRGGMRFEGDYYIMIQPEKAPVPFKALCKMFNNSGWTVWQRRMDGTVDFYRDWSDYKNGFGNLEGEFWLGNEKLFYLTNQGDMKVRLELEEWNGNKTFAEYDFFKVSDEDDKYRLRVRGYHGTAGDSLTSYWENHDGMPFSTRDRDNDGRYYDNCAEHYHGAWWFNNCFDSHLNGRYYKKGSHKNYFQRNGIQWNSIHLYSSLKHVEIMLKPADNPKLANEV